VNRVKQLGLVELVTLSAFSATCLAGCSPVYAPSLTRANEASAVVSLKAIAVAQIGYRTVCGNGGYAASLVVLGTQPGRGSGDGFIDAALGASNTPQKSGYIFTLTAGAGSSAGPSDCNGTPTLSAFYATAVPVAPDKTGKQSTRAFAINQSGVVWQSPAGTFTAPTEPFGPPSSPIK
jgi:hypothetical protein